MVIARRGKEKKSIFNQYPSSSCHKKVKEKEKVVLLGYEMEIMHAYNLVGKLCSYSCGGPQENAGGVSAR